MGSLAWPFRSGEMLASGAITEHRLRKQYEQVYPGVYAPRGAELTAIQRARAAWLWSERRGVVVGLSAAALHGSRWIGGALPAELVHENHKSTGPLRIYRDSLLPQEIWTVDGIAVASPARTAFDLCRRLRQDAAIERVDALIAATGITVSEIEVVAAHHHGVRGIRRLPAVLDLVDGGAESPWETRTRMILVRAGFPKPQTQIQVFNRYGDFIARIDMGYEDEKLGIEFDGAQHWTDARQRTRDIDRHAELAAEGWTLIRVSADLLRHRAGTIVSRVADVLGSSSGNLTRENRRNAS